MKIIESKDIPILDLHLENQGLLSFTSMLSGNENYIFLKEHLERLCLGYKEVLGTELEALALKNLKEFLLTHWSKKSYYRIVILKNEIQVLKKEHKFHNDLVRLKLFSFEKENSFGPMVKNGNYQQSFKLREEAIKNNCDEALFFDNHFLITEAVTSNVFILSQDNVVYTPPASSQVLAGVTRKKIIETLRDQKREVKIENIQKDFLLKAKEIWLTNAVEGLRFVSECNGIKYKRENSSYEKIIATFGRFGEKINAEEELNSQVSKL